MGRSSWLVYDSHVREPDAGLRAIAGLPAGWQAQGSDSGTIDFDDARPRRGFEALRFMENRRYLWQLRGPGRISSSLEASTKSGWISRVIAGELSGEFEIRGYLGAAWIRIGETTLRFEVATAKLNFETEYHSMLADIALECQQLLLDWHSPTSASQLPDPLKTARLLLERFLFARSLTADGRLRGWLEQIRRNPDTQLVRESSWRPYGVYDSVEFYRDPFRFGRGWSMRPDGPVPDHVLHVRRGETHDTPANRFVRFAVEEVRRVAEMVLAAGEVTGQAARAEAIALRDEIDAELADQFFQEVGALQRLPTDSQVLQKREGYKQVFAAWIGLDAASMLDWPGREDVYDGTLRDVARLYEYWTYFVLNRALRDLPGTELVRRHGSVFVITGDGLRINLRSGTESLAAFRTIGGPRTLRMHLYYNRDAAPRRPEFPGSYSRRFRPDFSLFVFPDDADIDGMSARQAEDMAAAAGHLTIVHFDAKYRAERVEQLFGVQEVKDDEGCVPPEDVLRELDDEASEFIAATGYRRDDLLKMHAYNDALRRTVGSYILYPGPAGSQTLFSEFHELLPGIGAFGLRPEPGGQPNTAALRTFLSDLIELKANRFSQLYDLSYSVHSATRLPPLAIHRASPQPPMDLPAAQVHVLEADIFSRGELHRALAERWCWFAAAHGQEVVQLDLRLTRANVVVPYVDGKTVGWWAPILSVAVVHRDELRRLLRSEPYGEAVSFYVVRFGEPVPLEGELLWPNHDLAESELSGPVARVRTWAEAFSNS